ncbi:hypothetical protein [Methylobacillus flagellatus]|uniref:hypothetical protein n=1 Tax=Methylobacillus flagellatus TaxID=405 RepID=UPI0010F8D3FB|nr:hypothetical protein [Methylobacillus flagellatus]
MKNLFLVYLITVSMHAYGGSGSPPPEGAFSADGELFIFTDTPIVVNDIFRPFVCKLGAKWKDLYGYINEFERSQFFIQYGSQSSILTINGKVSSYYPKDLNGDTREELVIEYVDSQGVYHFSAYSSGLSAPKHGFIDMYSLNKVDVVSADKEFVVDTVTGLIKSKIKNKNGALTPVIYKVTESFDFKIKPVLQLEQNLQ